MSCWWIEPIWNICSWNWIESFPQLRGGNKPPPGWQFHEKKRPNPLAKHRTQFQLMVNWWFGFLGSPYERDCYLRGIPRILNHQLTSWPFLEAKKQPQAPKINVLISRLPKADECMGISMPNTPKKYVFFLNLSFLRGIIAWLWWSLQKADFKNALIFLGKLGLASVVHDHDQ